MIDNTLESQESFRLTLEPQNKASLLQTASKIFVGTIGFTIINSGG